MPLLAAKRKTSTSAIVFEFTRTCVREVMVPRTRIVGLGLSASRDQVVELLPESMYSRYPVYRDTIEGKDLLGRMVAGEPFYLSDTTKPPVFVPESKKVTDLLKEMQRSQNQMALVVDGFFSIFVLGEYLEIRLETDLTYDTIAGMILDALGRL